MTFVAEWILGRSHRKQWLRHKKDNPAVPLKRTADHCHTHWHTGRAFANKHTTAQGPRLIF